MRTLSAALDSRMPAPATTLFNIETLRRFDGPAWFLGGGFLAGLLCFAVWVHGRHDGGRHALQAKGNGVVGMETPDANKGVLDDITGSPRPGASSAQVNDDLFSTGDADAQADGAVVSGTLAPDQNFDQDYDQNADAMSLFAPNCATSSPERSAGLSGVHTGPGATALTRMPRSSRLPARLLVKAWIAPLVAE